MSLERPVPACGSCVHFRNDAGYLETIFKGLSALSSGYASVRADDGLCDLHDRYLSARSACPSYAERARLAPSAS